MIIKILPSKQPRFKKMLEYMFRDTACMKNDKGEPYVFSHNITSTFDIPEWVKIYKANEAGRLHHNAKQTNFFTHEIVSFGSRDKENISPAKLSKIVRHYFRQRNNNGIYLSSIHEDKNHIHLHILASGVDRTGYSLRMEKSRFKELKVLMQDFQEKNFKELSHSIIDYNSKGTKSIPDKEFQILADKRELHKTSLADLLEKTYAIATSREAFLKMLLEHGIDTYTRNGLLTGVVFKNRKYRLSRIGFSAYRLAQLDKSADRQKELSAMRSRTRSKGIERNRP